MTLWRPRCSSVGYYAHCLRRAALDRAIALGLLDVEETAEKGSSPYADLGTCEHFELQDGMRCTFPGPAKDFAPTAEEWANAATLFGSLGECKEAVRTVAVAAAKHLPKIKKPWRAEVAVENAYCSGHVDFLDPDGEWLVDLKTVSRPPMGGKMKRSHLCQMLMYRACIGMAAPRKVMVLYIDSREAKWVCPATFEVDEALDEYQWHLENFILALHDSDPTDFSMPQVGPWCIEDFCPYRGGCGRRFKEPMAEVIDTSAVPTTPTLFGGT